MQVHLLREKIKLLLTDINDKKEKNKKNPDPKSTDTIFTNLGKTSVDQCLRWQRTSV